MRIALAAIATAVLYWFVNRYNQYVATEFSTLNTIDPASVPGETPREDSGDSQASVDRTTIEVTMQQTLPMAQIASSYGAQVSPNPLNPVLPAMGYGNTYLDGNLSIFNNWVNNPTYN